MIHGWFSLMMTSEVGYKFYKMVFLGRFDDRSALVSITDAEYTTSFIYIHKNKTKNNNDQFSLRTNTYNNTRRCYIGHTLFLILCVYSLRLHKYYMVYHYVCPKGQKGHSKWSRYTTVHSALHFKFIAITVAMLRPGDIIKRLDIYRVYRQNCYPGNTY